jgi:hypothetical protein
MPATTTENEQVIEAVVSGPAPANRLYTCTGRAVLNMYAWSGQGGTPETWTFLVGPALPQRFIRATASVSVVSYAFWSNPPDPNMPSGSWYSLDIQSVEADWDDESGKTELRVEVAIGASGGNFGLAKIGFTGTVLAEVP